ncbi:MAG: hypothetical protein ABEK59_06910 [Halobacteria archaeon]
MLVGPEGKSLYLFTNDSRGSDSSTCTDKCADAWPPLTVEGDVTKGDDVNAEVSIFERDDGKEQVTVNGWPISTSKKIRSQVIQRDRI